MLSLLMVTVGTPTGYYAIYSCENTSINSWICTMYMLYYDDSPFANNVLAGLHRLTGQ